MRDIVITLPKTILWEDYEKELIKGDIMNFKVNHLPKDTGVGMKCYLVYKGFVKGYMLICDLVSNDFICSTTGKKWDGNFIQRTGKFHFMTSEIPMKGFQGFKYVDF